MRRLFEVKRRTLFGMAVFLAMALVGSMASGADGAEPVAAVSAEGQMLSFAPKVADGMLLTVSGPTVYSSREFAAGEAPSFVLGAGPDGDYKYELRSQPAIDHELMRIAEETDDDRLRDELERLELERVVIQTGWFTVAGGSVALLARETTTEASGGSER